MSRFLLMLLLLPPLLLPGAEFVASNIDEVESFTTTTLGDQFSMAVTPKITLQKPSPASHGPTNKSAIPNPPHPKDSKNKPRPLKDSPVKPIRIQSVQGGTKISDTNTTLHSQKMSAPYEARMAVTTKSHILGESTVERSAIRKGPTPANKAKMVVKPNTSRYQSLPHAHHKNLTSKPETGQLMDSNVTTAAKPQRTVTTPLRNTFKPGQKGSLLPSAKVKHVPVGLQGVKPMGRQFKEKASNTTQLLNTLVNQNFSFTNSIQHMAMPSNSTIMTVKEVVPNELNSLHSQDLLRDFENVTSVPNVDGQNNASRTKLFGRVDLLVGHDSRVMQELKSKVKVNIPERNMIYNHMNLNFREGIFSTEQPGLVQEEKGHPYPELTTQVNVSGPTQLVKSATGAERTSDKLSYSNSYSHGHTEPDTEAYTQVMIGASTHLHKKQTMLTTTPSREMVRNQTHSHKHRHTVQGQHNQESNAISQHNATVFDRTTNLELHRHHSKHLHNYTHPHSHNHHKHQSDKHTQRNHISQTPMHQNIQEQSDVVTQIQHSQPSLLQLHKTQNSTTQIQSSQSSPPQFYTDSINPVQVKTSLQNDTQTIPNLLYPSLHLEALQENQSQTQSVLNIQPELTTQTHEHTMLYPVSITDSTTAIQKVNNLQQGTQSAHYQNLHTEQAMPYTTYSLTQTTGPSITTNTKHALTTQSQLGLTTYINLEKKTEGEPENHPTYEEISTPMQKQNTVKYQPDLTFQSQPTLSSATKPGSTFQTQPEIVTHTLVNLVKKNQSQNSTHELLEEFPQTGHDSLTRSGSDWSKHSSTITLPLLLTQSQSEPTTERPPDFVIYYNATQTKSGNRPHTEPVMDRMEKSTYTEQTTNGPTNFSTKPEQEANSTTESTNHTEEMLTIDKKYPTQEEQLKTEMGPISENRTNSFTQIQSTTTRESTTNTEPATEETATPNPILSTKKSPIESFTQKDTTTQHITNTEQATTEHETESDPQQKTPIANDTETTTQASVTIHIGDEIGPTSQRELFMDTPLKPNIHHHHETTDYKELIQSVRPDTDTPTYTQQSMRTIPELTQNTSEDQATEMYTPTERTVMPENTRATEGSTAVRTVEYNDNPQNDSDISKTTPAWGVETLHPTSLIPSGSHHSHEPATTVKIYRPEAPNATKSVTSPASSTFTQQTLGEFMSVQPGRDRIFIVEEQQPLFKVASINVTHRMDVPQSVTCVQTDKCRSHFIKEVTSTYSAAPGFSRIDIINMTFAGGILEYKVLLSVRVGSSLTSEQELVLTNPTTLFKSSGIPVLLSIRNASLAVGPTDPCTDWFSCPRGFHCVPQRKLSALCLSPCHSAFCHNDGICIHRKGQDPACQCPVGTDFWYMGPTCDYRMTHHRLAAIACAVVFCIIICAAAAVFILVRRFQTQILQQKVAQTQSSYRRFSRFDDVPTHFWCPSQTWLTTSASLNSLDNPAFSSSEEVFPLQALGSCVCGCQNGAPGTAPANPLEQPARGPPRLETSCSSVNDLMIDSGKASDVSVCSWPMEPIHWTPFPILHQLSLQSPFHARRPHSYFEGMELVNTERSWTA